MSEAAGDQVRFATALGAVTVAWTAAGVVSVRLPEDASVDGPGAGHGVPDRAFPPGAVPSWIADLVSRLVRHLGGMPQDFSDIPVDTTGWPPFFTRARRAARDIAPGTVVTYGGLAARAGRPRAARAAGRAMATNPVPLIVPCHRIVASGGLGGFSGGGPSVKRRLLALEGAASVPDPGHRGVPARRP